MILVLVPMQWTFSTVDLLIILDNSKWYLLEYFLILTFHLK